MLSCIPGSLITTLISLEDPLHFSELDQGFGSMPGSSLNFYWIRILIEL
jgi:hypothetical protein